MLNKIIILLSLTTLSVNCNGGCSGDKTGEPNSAAIEETAVPAADITEENAQTEADNILKELNNL